MSSSKRDKYMNSTSEKEQVPGGNRRCSNDMKFSMRVAAQLFLGGTEKNKNLVVSPLSLNLILNMLVSGSKGSTLDQLLKFLELDNIEEANSQSSRMLALVSPDDSDENVAKGPALSFVNGLWVDQKFSLEQSFQQTCQHVYNMKPKVVDFESQGEEVRKKVNSWAEKSTKGLVKNLLRPHCFDSNTALALANALYFKGEWGSPFNTSKTQTKKFHLLDGKEVEVSFIIDSGRLEEYYESIEDDFKVLKLPYQSDGRRFSMYMFLPNKRDGLIQLLQKVDSNPRILSDKDSKLKKAIFSRIWIPKLKFSYEFEAEAAMRRLGLTLPFDELKADLTGIGESNSGDPLFVSLISQKAYVEVDEKGTEAAAVTFLEIASGCCQKPTQPPPELSFIADHPFIFMIKEEVSGFVFFLGTVLNPLSEA